ncbi:MAG: PAS domain S-box protein [Syntrophales bacterium]|nr:PAS domain S-box protein [Syntrophales bacterium]
MFAHIFDSVFDSALIAGLTGNIIEANEVCCRTLGYKRKALLGMDLPSILSEEDAAMILGLAQKEKKRGLHLNLRAADGTMVPVEVNAQHITHGGKEVILCVARDITALARAGEALEKKEEKFRAVIDEIGDGYWETDLTGRLTFVNDAMCRIAEATREELLSGVNFSENADPETKKELYKIFEQVYLTGKPSEVGDHEVTRRDGKTTGVFQFNVSLIRDDKNQPVGFRGITRDVTKRRAMEAALRESEESYRNVLALAPDGIAIVRKKDATYLQVNDTFCQQTGYSAEEILGRTSSELNLYVAPADRKRLFGTLAREGRVDGIEIQYRAKDGTILDDLVSARPIRFRGEDCFLIVATVITSLKKAQEALRQSEERYRTILEGIEAGYYELDLPGRFTFFNDAMCRITGFSKEELMGMDYREYTTPEIAQRAYEVFKEVFRTGKPAYIADHELINKEGKAIALEQSVLLVRNDKGEAVGFRGIARDVTRRKEMEGALRESEEKYRTILESMEEGYYEVDLTGRFTFFNNALCRMVGFSREELMGMSNRGYTTPETAKMIFKIFSEVYRTGKPAEIVDHEVIKKDKSRSTHELSVSLMRDEGGTPIGFRGVVRDITRRKQAEEEIRVHREHLALINQILRHDLTNDLIVMQSGLNLYESSHEKELLEETAGRVKKSLELIGRMRELESFISSHKNLKAYKIQDVVNEVARDYPFIDVKIKGKAQVMADDSLFSVVDNIMRNAVIHGKADRIEVTIGWREGMCEVRIADNGSGIPDKIKGTIFEEGFKYGETGHTGLGLHIVKKALEKYGGYVYTEDNGPKGAVFVLMFKTI